MKLDTVGPHCDRDRGLTRWVTLAHLHTGTLYQLHPPTRHQPQVRLGAVRLGTRELYDHPQHQTTSPAMAEDRDGSNSKQVFGKFSLLINFPQYVTTTILKMHTFFNNESRVTVNGCLP